MTYPDLQLIEKLQKKFLRFSINSLTKDDTINLINHQKKYIRNLEYKLKRRK